MAEAEGLYPTLVANSVLNAFLSYTATVLNIITIQALKKASSLARPLKTLLLSLAASDLGVGCLVQPIYIAVLVTLITEPNTGSGSHVISSLIIAFVAISNLLGSVSFFGVFALTVDRFLAIHLHLRYQALVTHKRVVAVVTLIWVFSAAYFFLFFISINVRVIFSATTGALSFATTGLLYCKIYAAVRQHRNQINALQVQQVVQNGDMANAARQRKTAVATFYVYIVFLVCYLPFWFVFPGIILYYESVLWKHLLCYSLTLAFLNSSLNPLIYCCKMRRVRRAVMDILRNNAFSTSYRMAGTGDFYSTLVANCFFNAFLLFTALVLNIITIQALRKISSFPKPLKTLLLSLAVSDLGVGLLVHPVYILLLVMNIEQNTNNRIFIMVYKAYLISSHLLCTASFLSIIALTVDRFLAIHLHLRYQEFVTHKRVVAVVISVWVWCSCISLFVLNSVLENVLAIITVTIGTVCLTTTGFIYCKIYSIVRHHKNQIHALQLQPVG
ncbi:unnamed protein product [Porites lobata]|uniref:G-protein coupled receptors family 1 profile domain-containing protein n=1 Tax=Porites lobata TaxID=104759 RepID=A0ABN8NJ90_9CNID|nr:unnamed protein product [Porites lobata]